MRKNCYFVLLLSVTLFLFSCSKDEVNPEITFDQVDEQIRNLSEYTFTSESGQKEIKFTTNCDWSVNIVGDVTWCKLSKLSGGSGSQSITISVDDNPFYEDRYVTLQFVVGDKYESVSVCQKEKHGILLTRDMYELPVAGGNIDIEVKSNIEYSIVVPEEFKDWIHESSNSTSTRSLTTYNKTYKIDPSEEYSKREGFLLVESANREDTVTVYQAGEGILILSQNEFNLSSSAQEIEIDIKSNFNYEITMPNVNWISTANSDTRSVSSNIVKLCIAENTSYDSRNASVFFYDKNSSLSDTVVINQSQVNAIIVSQKEFNFFEDGGYANVDVNASVKYTSNINCSWIQEVKPATSAKARRALEKSSVKYQILASDDKNLDRTGTIKIENVATGTSESIIVHQKKAIKLNTNETVLYIGANVQIVAENALDNKSMTWTSSNNNIATVDQNGKITAVASGTATITVTSASGKYSNSVNVTVKSIEDDVVVTSKNADFVGTVQNYTIQNNTSYDLVLTHMYVRETWNFQPVLLEDKDMNETIKPGSSYSYGVDGNLGTGLYSHQHYIFTFSCNGLTFVKEGDATSSGL